VSVVHLESTARPLRRRPHPATVYRRRRAVTAAAVAALVLLTASSAPLLAGLGGDPASASETRPAPTSFAPAAHVAEPGDTLWAIADRYRGSVGRDAYLEALIVLNGGTAIQVGQAVALP
jgi:Tfp pilus assembly protein FimV